MIMHKVIDSQVGQVQSQAMRYGMTIAVTPETYAWSLQSIHYSASDGAQSLLHTRALYDLVQPHGLSDMGYDDVGNRAQVCCSLENT